MANTERVGLLAACGGPLACGSLAALGRVNLGYSPKLIEPRYCVGSNPTLIFFQT
jgi:hypothetical protein